MSFQGDVGGIGLADLLQSLARGREGVLTLHSRSGLRSALGIQEGMLHLLPEPDEDAEIWRARTRQARARDPEALVDSLHMSEIARAQRIETLYQLLDSDGVHFRFAPGPLPKRPNPPPLGSGQRDAGTPEPGSRRDGVYCPGQPVEGLLLEYARLKDEAANTRSMPRPSVHAVVIAVAPPMPGSERLFVEIDGASNLTEIADRLGQPLRQLRIAVTTELARGVLRLALPSELFELAMQELAQGQPARAASRLIAWCEASEPGPSPATEAQLLASEWQQGTLQLALRSMPVQAARTILRRIDLALANPMTTVEHWKELAAQHSSDALCSLHLLVSQVRSGADPNAPSMRELISLARGFADGKCRMRSGAVLRVAAERLAGSPAHRLEVGSLMLAVGLHQEGAPWVLAAARSLVQGGEAEKAISPLRTLIAAVPGHRDARRLLARARAITMRRTLVRKNSLVMGAIVLALSVGAIVTFRSGHERDEHLAAVREAGSDPRRALALLDEHFEEDQDSGIAALRQQYRARIDEIEMAERTVWTDLYREAQTECTVGDPLLGLRRALELPRPPQHTESEQSWPLVSDLFGGLDARISTELRDLGPVAEDEAQAAAEGRALETVVALGAELAARVPAGEGSGTQIAFAERLARLVDEIGARATAREAAKADRLRRAQLARQNQMYAAAQTYEAEGDIEQAVESYRDLVESDKTGRIGSMLGPRIRTVEEQMEGLKSALTACREGRHAEARQTLLAAKLDLSLYRMPWKLASFPSPARARLSDGSIRTTPLELQSSFGERIQIQLTCEGYEPLEIVLDDPADLDVPLSRIPERAWMGQGRIDALPVAVGADHVVCDRSGEIARLSEDGRTAWKATLGSLGGVARAPVFLPKKPGTLLVVTEHGDVWLFEVESGKSEGPWSSGSPPVAGPEVGESSVTIRFLDGTIASWETRLKPSLGTAGDAPPATGGAETSAAHPGDSAGLVVLRRGQGTRLESPFAEVDVEIGEDHFAVGPRGARKPAFTVRREGEWSYVAWEAPQSSLPRGRLWIADGRGLRSFLP